jgi:tetratricopeptide (TPR) repeat protein
VLPAPPPASNASVAGLLDRGTAIGRFVVLGLLGKGGMGEVYAAHDPELDRKVAIKLLRAGAESESPEGRARLMREAQAIARVSHPNVVVVYDVGTFARRVFIAMELCDGHTLRYWTHARARTWPEILEVFAAAGRGLGAAHERGLVHRDFKPDNVMISADGQVRVMDFGLVQLRGDRSASGRWETSGPARLAAAAGAADPDDEEDVRSTQPVGAALARFDTSDGVPEVELTEAGVSLGTPAYMSPEQFRNEPVDARTDQFSFCVALYEAVYGERPFPGRTVHEISEAVRDGRVREPPAGREVPAWLREALLRGLRREPGERWPSMGALSAALEKHPTVESRRRFVAAAAAKLDGIWEAPRGGAPVETPAKTEMRSAFLATGEALAAQAWQRTSEILDRYAARWSELYVEACEATHVRGEQSAEVLDLRMACLAEGRADLEALVRVLRRPTAEVVENAVKAADALGTLERCANVELLRAVVRPPADPETRAEVDGLRGRLAEVRALCRVGRLKDGLAAGAPLVQAARALGYGPLLAEVLLAVCRVPEERGALEEAARLSEEAFLTAVACGHEEAAAEAGALLVGHSSLRPEAAEVWGRITEALLRRIGGHDVLWGWLYTSRAGIRSRQGRPAEALEDERRSLGAKQRALAPEHPDIAISLGNIAVYLDEVGQLDEAVAEGARAVALLEHGYGPEHPRTALARSNLSEFLARCGRWDEAADAAARALACFEQEADPDGLFVFVSLTALGIAHLGAGRLDEAVRALERADRIGGRGAPTVGYRAQARFALARALWASGEERPRALDLARTAEREYGQAPSSPAVDRERAAVAAWLSTR